MGGGHGEEEGERQREILIDYRYEEFWKLLLPVLAFIYFSVFCAVKGS